MKDVSSIRKLPSKSTQRGAALLLTALIMVVSLSALLLAGLNGSRPDAKQAENLTVLNTAHEALVGYALSYADMHANRLPGHLPCPDADGDGLADTPCGAAGESAIGRLPWRTLGLPPLRDIAGECLWYVVSGTYKEDPVSGLSTDADGQFLIHDANGVVKLGNSPLDRAIAVVFAPGKVVQSQVRSLTPNRRTECGSTRIADGVSRASNYLEARNGINNSVGTQSGAAPGTPGSAPVPASIAATFVASPRFPEYDPADFNDTLIWISPADFDRVYTRMQAWVGDQVRACLQSYALSNGGIYPWPAILNSVSSPDYQDDSGERFGRVASDLTNTAALGFDPVWPNSCFSWAWWNDWREQVFYAVDQSVAPSATSGGVVTVDGAASTVAILLAGRRNSAQSRSTNSEKGSISNYLESANIPGSGAGQIPAGDETFQTTTLTQAMDDYVCNATACP